MKKVTIIIVIVLVAVSAVFFLGSDNRDGERSSDRVEESKPTSDGGGFYEKYNEEKVARASEGDVVLFFKASWCPTCNALDANIRKNLSEVPTGLTILEVDFDKSLNLRQKYGVTLQHTLVQVDTEGNLVNKWIGSPTLEAVVSQLK